MAAGKLTVAEAETVPLSGVCPSVSEWMRERWLALLVSIGLLLVLYLRDLGKLVSDWVRDENYSHGFLVPIAAAWLVWNRRREIARLRVAPRAWGLLLIVLAILQLSAGVLGAENFVAHTSLLVFLSGMIVFLFGVQTLRQVLFPLSWLLFMIPLPTILFNAITFPLQLLASRLAAGLLDLIQIPNLREGNILYLSTFTVGIVEACSGIRSLTSLLALTTLAGYVLLRRNWSRLALALAAFPVAIGVNAMRVAGTGLAGNYLGPRWAEGFFHTFSGLVLFFGAVAMLMVIARGLTRWERIPLGSRA